MNQTAKKLLDLVTRAAADPVEAMAKMREAQVLASELASMPPTQAASFFLPGLMMPCTSIIPVSGIPQIAAASDSNPIPIQMRTPGVIVGLHGATLENNNDSELAKIAYQIKIEQGWDFVTDSNINASPFASFSSFSRNCTWIPVMLPARGAGQWLVTFRNRAAATAITPIFEFAFLQGLDAYQACGGR